MTTITRPGNVTSHQAVKPETWPSAMSFPSAGVGGWTPKPRNESAASMRIAAAIEQRHRDDDRPDAVRQHVAEHDSQIARPGCLRRLDELLLAEREERAADDACEVHPEEERKNEPDAKRLAVAEIRREDEQDDEERDHENEIDEPHEQVVDLPAVVTGDCSHDGAQTVATPATKSATQSDVRSPKMTRLR